MTLDFAIYPTFKTDILLYANSVSTSLPVWAECVLLTRSSLRHLRFQIVALLLQRFDVAPLAEEDVGDHRLARNQDTCQQG